MLAWLRSIGLAPFRCRMVYRWHSYVVVERSGFLQPTRLEAWRFSKAYWRESTEQIFYPIPAGTREWYSRLGFVAARED